MTPAETSRAIGLVIATLSGVIFALAGYVAYEAYKALRGRA